MYDEGIPLPLGIKNNNTRQVDMQLRSVNPNINSCTYFKTVNDCTVSACF